MKKYITYMLGLVMVLSACKKFEEEPKDTVDAKLNTQMTAYETQLVSSQFGWKGYLLTGSDDAALFTFKFDNKNRVVMTSDIEAGSPESSYRMKALQQPTLIFDTYSLLHLIADPDPNVFDGEPGEGYLSDFEFGIIKASADTLQLIGLTNHCKLTLVRATAATTTDAMHIEKEALESQFASFKTYFKRAKIGETECEINLNAASSLLTIGYLEGSTYKTVSSKYYVSGNAISLFNPLQIGKATIDGLSGVKFDATSGFISAQSAIGEIQIKEASAPMLYNKDDAPNFLNGPSLRSWWENYDGFTVEGKADAYGIKRIVGFTDLDYYVTGANKGSLRTYLGIGNLAYFYKINSTMSGDGILLNTVASTSGSTTNATVKAIVDQMATALTEPKGFYVIRVGAGFDLVAVKDARSWINFE